MAASDMKYAKRWKAEAAPLLARHEGCLLDYVKWKKRMVHDATPHFRRNWRVFLVRACERADSRTFGAFGLSLLWRRPLPPDARAAVARLNAETLRKICKKLDKLNVPLRRGEAKAWRAAAVARQAFRFLGGRELAAARLLAGEPLECPVCLEPLVFDATHLPACGHGVCLTCWRSMVRAGCDRACSLCRRGAS